MILEIVKVRPYKKSQTEGTYMMIEMKDVKTNEWYRTYICPMYRNFKRWRKIARIGNEIFFHYLKMKTKDIIDADSYPILIRGRKVHKLTLQELGRLGVFG